MPNQSDKPRQIPSAPNSSRNDQLDNSHLPTSLTSSLNSNPKYIALHGHLSPTMSAGGPTIQHQSSSQPSHDPQSHYGNSAPATMKKDNHESYQYGTLFPTSDQYQGSKNSNNQNQGGNEFGSLVSQGKKPAKSNDNKDSRNKSSKNKRVIVPVRVEPKVFFANERTFLSWLNFAIVLGSLALSLLNFGNATSRISGLVFTAIAMAIMIYALILFQWRAERIRQRDSRPYDDRRGPTLLVVVLLSAIMLNFYLNITKK